MTNINDNPVFKLKLEQLNISPEFYLKQAIKMAKLNKIPFKNIEFSQRKDKKLKLIGIDNKTYNFGSNINNDFIIWTELEKRKEVPKDYAKMKRNVFRTSHEAMNYDRNNVYSANNLSIKILW